MSFALRSSLPVASRRAGSSGRALVLARAEKDEQLSFKPNDNSALGYTDEDSAGQSNIFAVEPKTYVQGSTSDSVDSSPTLLLGAVAGAAALVVLVLGLGANKPVTAVAETQFVEAGQYQTLAYYRTALK